MYYERYINELHVGENPASGLFPGGSLLLIRGSQRLEMIIRKKEVLSRITYADGDL